MGELATAFKEIMTAFDRQDFAALRTMLAPDGQGVDEITRRWLRDADEIGAYFDQLAGSVDDVSTTVSDLEERTWGEVGLVTCWLDQSYTLDGEPQKVSAPTSVVLRRVDGEWRAALIHSVPLPEN
ncbi:nuclear transport factor 2 family protein [Kribbella sp. NPDC056951]|uniref:nuclear transport factor 2 family protein n=1 Tax=Kribbella sp. NPDC056951 TaxID=3345978 RepID=UPI003624F3CA